MKDFNLGGRLGAISKQGGTINFGGSYVFSAAQKSGFKDYTLDAILNLLMNRGLTIQEYLKQANVNKISTINMIDRKVGRELRKRCLSEIRLCFTTCSASIGVLGWEGRTAA